MSDSPAFIKIGAIPAESSVVLQTLSEAIQNILRVSFETHANQSTVQKAIDLLGRASVVSTHTSITNCNFGLNSGAVIQPVPENLDDDEDAF